MNDAPTGNNGRTSRPDMNLEFAVLSVEGGTRYAERLRQMEDAFKKLQVGHEAQKALAQAQRKLNEADAVAHAARNAAATTLAEAQAKSEAQTAKATQLFADAKIREREVDNRIKDVEAREPAVIETNANAGRLHAEAKRLRDVAQGKLDYLSTNLREIAATDAMHQ
jgi:hypothetical protein